jgi:uncharacterized membrane protein YeaQ/YmgE (transglycosylase-associated protein family)
MTGLFLWIIIGLVAGWLAGVILKGTGYGVVWDVVLGIAGAVIGGWLFGMLGLAPSGGLLYSILVALIGACVLIGISRLFGGKKV